jgi:non-ribosomal peptide synthetase component E (peptide arylation enzyme)
MTWTSYKGDSSQTLKPRLGKHEMIAALSIVEQLPRTPVGKIDKKPLYAAEARS